MAFKAVVFDMDGTINMSKEYYAAYDEYAIPILSDLLNLSREEVRSKMDNLRGIALGFTKRVELMGVQRLAFYKEMATRVPCKQLIHANPKLRAMLEELRTMGYKLALLTNTGRPLVNGILDALGLPFEIFDAVSTSTETGLKPDDEPYIYVADKLGMSLQECVYVGDRYEMEIETAQKLGMTTILLSNSTLDESTRRGYSHYVIDSIYDIPKIFRNTLNDATKPISRSNTIRTQMIPFQWVSLQYLLQVT